MQCVGLYPLFSSFSGLFIRFFFLFFDFIMYVCPGHNRKYATQLWNRVCVPFDHFTPRTQLGLIPLCTCLSRCLFVPIYLFVCVECLIGKQKKPILFKVTEPSSVPYRAPPACAKRAAYPDPPPVIPLPESIAAQVTPSPGLPRMLTD